MSGTSSRGVRLIRRSKFNQNGVTANKKGIGSSDIDTYPIKRSPERAGYKWGRGEMKLGCQNLKSKYIEYPKNKKLEYSVMRSAFNR
ncbi:hypothetical protein AYI69_g3782 [Smittium culicis]|uniref:Uncharacterized protein n=1 Tax=Smittium culicis TaxID=133412 RepID=A0A1R1YIU2_9FUNG|nr:hypothetical protein AYI69_g3782 [Smittium culicis]